MNCPNCSKEFIEHINKAYHCSDCGWLTQIDNKWVTCSEPVKQQEPPLLSEPKVKEPKPIFIPAEPGLCVKKYLGGLVTVTIKDKDDEDND